MLKRKTMLLGSVSAVALMVAAAPAAMASDLGSDLGKTKLEISGYIKLDAIYQFGQELNNGTSFNLSTLGSANAQRAKGHFRLHAKQSRIRFKTMTPTDLGEMTTYLEGDFESGTSSSVTNRSLFSLRQAYGTLGPFLAGQAYSIFTGTFPETLDFAGPVGVPYKRNPQIRYTFNATPSTKLEFAIERNATIGNAADAGTARKMPAPDFTAGAIYSAGNTTLKFMGIVRDLAVDGGGPPAANDSTVGWGAGLNGSIGVFGNDSIIFDATGGQGIGSYLEQVYNNDYVVDAAGSIHAPSVWATVIGYEHHWSPSTRSTVSWGHYENVDAGKWLGVNASNGVQSVDTIHVNYLWSPVPNTTFGVEYQHGMVGFAKTTAGVPSKKDNTDNAVQFTAQYLF